MSRKYSKRKTPSKMSARDRWEAEQDEINRQLARAEARHARTREHTWRQQQEAQSPFGPKPKDNPSWRQPGPAAYVASGRWAKIGRGHYRHHTGAEVKKVNAGWKVTGTGTNVDGDVYGTASAAMWNVERVTDRSGERLPAAVRKNPRRRVSSRRAWDNYRRNYYWIVSLSGTDVLQLPTERDANSAVLQIRSAADKAAAMRKITKAFEGYRW